VSEPEPRISAVVCSHNRAAAARDALDSLAAQTLDPHAYEVLAVDSGSTDGTADLFTVMARAAPNLRALHEPRPGSARARNRGWRAARGVYVAYLDDDAVAAPDWLERMLDAFEQTTPRPGCVGGRVAPIWEASRPPWLSDRLALALSLLDWSDQPGWLPPERWIVGCNMAMPRRALEWIGGFHEALGRGPGSLLSHDESLQRAQLDEIGERCWYDPRILVWHRISAARLTRSWFLRRTFWNGVSTARMEQLLHPSPPGHRRRLGVRALRRLLAQPRLWGDLACVGVDPSRLDPACVLVGRLGYALGLLFDHPAPDLRGEAGGVPHPLRGPAD
jgi:GT2 family glycosyltransferase